MENFFQEQFYGDGDIFWFNSESLPVHRSAFMPYTNGPRIKVGSESIGNGSKSWSANKRMIEFLRRINQSAKKEPLKPDRERGHQHMINERMRREREKQNYLALRSMLSTGTRIDKNSIVQVAAMRIQELECYKVELERRNNELEAKLGKDTNEGTKIGIRVINPISGIDYMVGALKSLKKTGSRIRYIQSEFSDQKLTAVIHAESQMGDEELKKAVQGALIEVEQELLIPLPGSFEGQTRRERG
ncbi:hypothetical protein Pint_24676 [Pistacia integerrima]|uniref:Uncharacterized protein n=1 Tax=Pistacia integerrima TaxID=434235 RepID=A0ACC0YHU7_9ROSI|nr:hypothetical protein Pint_24676 [Pistacia integerrima]